MIHGQAKRDTHTKNAFINMSAHLLSPLLESMVSFWVFCSFLTFCVDLQNIWKDPACGDGVCESPFEFASYGRFGCRADCGRLSEVQNLTSIQIDLYYDFDHPATSIPSAVQNNMAIHVLITSYNISRPEKLKCEKVIVLFVSKSDLLHLINMFCCHRFTLYIK